VRRSKKAGAPCFDAMYGMDELNTILPQTDILVMALPATAETVGVLSRERIALLPRHAVVVNVGRGSAIDQDALIDALNSESIAGAALDVMVPEPLPVDHPLWDARNILITPHVSGNMSLGITRDLDVDLFCRDLSNYAAGRPLQQLVDRKLGY
jgi:phosphoglycerate dehydrogenase-like enzyme